MSGIRIEKAEFASSGHGVALLSLLDEYARDPMGGGKPLSDFAKTNLVDTLCSRPGSFAWLAYDGSTAVGLVIAFEGFSTFACRPILNIHDVVVTRTHRGRGITRLLFQEVERQARAMNCCKLTLEVLERNEPAQKAYRAFGFQGYELDPEMGRAMFWEKKLA